MAYCTLQTSNSCVLKNVVWPGTFPRILFKPISAGQPNLDRVHFALQCAVGIRLPR